MSTASKIIFRMIKNGNEFNILLTNSQDYDFGNIKVCPVHIEFSDSSCFPYLKQTAYHYTYTREQAELFVNQKQKMAYLLDGPETIGIRCRIYEMENQTYREGADYYAFVQVK